MSPVLRIFLFLVAIFFLFTVIKRVHKGLLGVNYSLVWFLLALVFILAAIFPGLVTWASSLVGIQTPVNFVSFVGIFVILLINLNYASSLSILRKEARRWSQEEAIEKYLKEGEDGRK